MKVTLSDAQEVLMFILCSLVRSICFVSNAGLHQTHLWRLCAQRHEGLLSPPEDVVGWEWLHTFIADLLNLRPTNEVELAAYLTTLFTPLSEGKTSATFFQLCFCTNSNSCMRIQSCLRPSLCGHRCKWKNPNDEQQKHRAHSTRLKESHKRGNRIYWRLHIHPAGNILLLKCRRIHWTFLIFGRGGRELTLPYDWCQI